MGKIIFEQWISFGSSRKSSGVVGVRIALLKLTSRCWPIFTERTRRTAHPNNLAWKSNPILSEFSPIIPNIRIFIHKSVQRFHLRILWYEARIE